MMNIEELSVICEEGAVTGLALKPTAPRAGEPPLQHRARQQLAEYLAGKRQQFDLPIAPKGTAFQQSVWAELQKIPYGKTKTYQDLASAIGKPKAARAVGMALNRNPLPLIIPCHRVIGKNGSMTGFAWGIPVKEWLLRLEKTAGR